MTIKSSIAKLAIHSLNSFFSPFNFALVPKRYFGLEQWQLDWISYFCQLFPLIENVESDTGGCGVASGFSLSILASLARSSDRRRKIYGFDSWEGLPQPQKRDVNKQSLAKKGKFSETNIDQVYTSLGWYGFTDTKIDKKYCLSKRIIFTIASSVSPENSPTSYRRRPIPII